VLGEKNKEFSKMIENNISVKDVHFRIGIWNLTTNGNFERYFTRCMEGARNNRIGECFFGDLWSEVADMPMLPFLQVGL
jgi:hypothetical protein